MKKSISIILLLVLALSSASCEKSENVTEVPTGEQSADQSETVTEDETTSPDTQPVQAYVNYLTGEKCETNLDGKRCVALTVKNDRAASPQYGLSEADIIYEVSVEGGLTRFLALYADSEIMTNVAPIIDSRSYFYTLAQGHDAIFVQAGTSSHTRSIFKANDIKTVDALSGELEPAFKRDEKLKSERGSENSIMTNGSMLKYAINSSGISKTSTAGFQNYLKFSYKENTARKNGIPCSTVSVPYTSQHSPYFKYSTLDNEYKRYQYDAEHTDAATGEQLSFSNVIILFADMYTADSETGELEMLFNGGDGYLVSSGKYSQIKWRCEDNGEMRFLTADEKEDAVLCTGKTFVCVCSTKLKDKVTLA